MIVLGIDPGGRNTGLAVRDRDDLLAWALEVRPGTARMPDGRYVRQVLGSASSLLSRAGVDPRDRDAYVVAVEGLAYWPEDTSRGQRPRDQRGLYGTAIILGAVLARWPDAVVVDSGRGVASLHPSAYPAEIRPPVNGAGKDRLVHVRAAWDHSHAGETAAKIDARGTPT